MIILDAYDAASDFVKHDTHSWDLFREVQKVLTQNVLCHNVLQQYPCKVIGARLKKYRDSVKKEKQRQAAAAKKLAPSEFIDESEENSQKGRGRKASRRLTTTVADALAAKPPGAVDAEKRRQETIRKEKAEAQKVLDDIPKKLAEIKSRMAWFKEATQTIMEW